MITLGSGRFSETPFRALASYNTNGTSFICIFQVSPNSRGAQAGLCAGDLILQICGDNVQGFTHDQAKGIILRGGNDLDFTIQR